MHLPAAPLWRAPEKWKKLWPGAALHPATGLFLMLCTGFFSKLQQQKLCD
jgi:hypothetical protein